MLLFNTVMQNRIKFIVIKNFYINIANLLIVYSASMYFEASEYLPDCT